MSVTTSVEPQTQLQSLVDGAFKNNFGISFIGLATLDGFDLCASPGIEETIDRDKLAAIASSVYALSEASARQIMGDDLEITTMEFSSGHFLFLKTLYQNKPCVLSVFASRKLSLGEARYTAKKLSDAIKEISAAG